MYRACVGNACVPYYMYYGWRFGAATKLHHGVMNYNIAKYARNVCLLCTIKHIMHIRKIGRITMETHRNILPKTCVGDEL